MPAVATITPGPDYSELLRQVRDLSLRITNLTEENKRLSDIVRQDAVQRRRSRSISRRPTSPSSNKRLSPSRQDSDNTVCWYHRRYGGQAQRCTKPWSYQPQEN
jgi:hypothetical protein